MFKGSIPFTPMFSYVNLLIKKKRIKKRKRNKRVMLCSAPHKKGTCLKVFITKPKKPNSASRKVAKVMIITKKKSTHVHIPGIKHGLSRYSTVLIRGGRVRDLPGVKYRVIRGKFDLKKVYLSNNN
jgi:small subunit ribosomal protein S12